MNEILRGLDFRFVYIDNILVASSTKEYHIENLTILFDRLKDKDILINPSKCVFEATAVKFLGYKVPPTALFLKRSTKVVQLQAPLNDLLQDKVNGQTPV